MTPFIQPSAVLPGGVITLQPELFETEPWVELGWPGFDPPTPTLHIHVFDDSGSVTAAHGADPVGNRFEEAKQAIELVAAWSFTPRAKVAVLHFDNPVGASGVVALNDRRVMTRLAPTLCTPRAGVGTSDLDPSLGEGERLAAAYPDHRVTLTVFSDFALTDVDPQAVLSRLTRFPGHVHAVVLGGQPPLDLFDNSSITFTSLSESDPPGTFAAAIHRSMTATRRGARHSVLHQPRTRRGKR